VGLNIGSRTPPEIAVSILAHLISLRNQSAEAACAAQIINQVQSITPVQSNNQAQPNNQEVCS